MKNSIFIILLFVANISFSQIYVEQSFDGSVTISPKGITSAGSNASGITGNTALGFKALNSNLSGVSNTAIGDLVFSNNTSGGNNIGIGTGTGFLNDTGSDNIFVGKSTAYNNSDGSYNIALGTDALSSNKSNSFNLAIGYQAMFYADNSTFGGNKHNLALGHSALRGSTTAADNTGTNNVAIGSNALLEIKSGSGNTVMGYEAGNTNTTGNNNVFVGRAAGDNNTLGSNNIVIGYNANSPLGIGSNQIRIGNSSITYAGVQVAWTVTSDARYKQNIKTLSYGLEFIKNLRPVSYTRTNDENQKLEFGVIAQEFEAVLQKFNIQNAGFLSKDDKGFYSVRYNDLIAPLIKAVQEQQQIIESQTQKTAQLEAKLLAFEAKLTSLVASKINNSFQNSDK
jgi:trimeric autotransporter adhesin